jgi:transitional endoplasmic reticulum ATPase
MSTAEATTAEEKTRAAILAKLGELGKITIGDDSLIFEGTKFILPESMSGDIQGARRYLNEYDKQQNNTFEFTRVFDYRPWDGANAFQNAMKNTFGTVGIGVTVSDMFGEYKPQYRTIPVSSTQSIQIPWGTVSFSPLSAEFTLHTTHNDFGLVFAIGVEAPRRYRAYIEAFFQVVENELKTNSIYRGKAITGGDDPAFLDTASIDPSRVVYSDAVQTQLDTNFWSMLRYTDTMRDNGIPLKRSVLVYGPYGTGKTLAGQLTAKEAVANGWTFILARPGKDDLQEVLHTAELYAPAVVWYEDIDNVAKGTSAQQISGLLDSLDGIANKGVAILAGFTTNHLDQIQKGVLRPGRIDALVEIAGLDAAGYEKLIKVVIPEKLLGSINYSVVAKAFDGFLPAFAKSAIDRALMYTISRNDGVPDVIGTADLVNAADGLRPQHDLMQDAKEGVAVNPLDHQLAELIKDSVNGMGFVSGVEPHEQNTIYSLKRAA